MSNPPSQSDEQRAAEPQPTASESEAVAQTVGGEAFAEAIQTALDDPSELQQEKDRVLRLQAEMENLRSRTAREINEERRYAPLPVVRDLLPVLDNMERAIEAAAASNESASLLEGFQLVQQQLLAVLEQHNCRRIEDVGHPFDPQVHEAILQQPSDEYDQGQIMLVSEAGYLLHDRVVRPSKVIISSGPQADAAATEQTE